ncbi:MAG: radical SAM peptide maturase [Candidatus Omnitrophota bacterium]
MKSFILARSQWGNLYVHERKKGSVLLCNPILHHLLKLHEEGTHIRTWIDRIGELPFELPGYGVVTKEDLEYYFKKFLFLSDKGFFSTPNPEGYLTDPITPEMVEYAIANSRQVTFEVTEKCGLQCKYCGYGNFYEADHSRGEENLDTGKAKRLLNFMADYWNSSLNVSHEKVIYISFYGGEPLLNIDFITEIVNYCRTQLTPVHHPVEFSMTTNALLLERYMDFLVSNQFNLLISLDGNEANNGYRVYKNGKPAFREIKRNIDALRKKYPDYFETRVNFNAVLHDKNSVPEIHEYITRTYGKIPRIGEIKNIGIKDTKQRDFMEIYNAINKSLHEGSADSDVIKKEMFIKLPDVQQLSTFLLKYSGFVFEDYHHLFSSGETQKPYPTGTCLPFSKKIFVTVSGELLPCETIVRRFVLGKVTDENVDLNFNEICETYNAYYNKLLDHCNGCYNKDACTACIFNLFLTDDMPVCSMQMNDRQFSGYLAKMMGSFEKEPALYSRIMEEVIIE